MATPGAGPSRLPPKHHHVELRAQTSKDAEAITRLYRIVLRSFYDDKFVVVGEQVLRFGVLPTDVLAARLGVQPKDAAALASRLVDDRMLCHFKRNERKEGGPPGSGSGGVALESKMLPRNYYYFHGPWFLAMLKYRLHHLRLKLDSSIVSSSYTTSFVCPQCRFTYSTLDVAHLLDLSTNSLRCERPGCGAELQEDEEEGDETRRGKDRMARFNEQCAGMIRTLEALEGVEVQAIEPVSFLADPANHKWKQLRSDLPRHQLDQQWFAEHANDELPNATTTNMSRDMAKHTISLTDSTTSAAALQAAKDEADRQRKENAIPEWLGKSTVSGEETALGIKERREREMRGEGSSSGGAAGQQGEDGKQAGGEGEEEEEDYYAQYARMQAQEEEERKKAEAAATKGHAAKRGRSSELPDGGGSTDEKRPKLEEDVKPAAATADDDDEEDLDEVA